MLIIRKGKEHPPLPFLSLMRTLSPFRPPRNTMRTCNTDATGPMCTTRKGKRSSGHGTAVPALIDSPPSP